MLKKKPVIKDEKLRTLMQKGGRIGAKNDFFELLRRAVFPTNNH